MSGAGSDPAAVPALVALAEAGGIGVVEVDPTHVNFPQGHPLHVGFTQPSGTDPALDEADALLIVDSRRALVSVAREAAPGAPIVHLAVDPSFSRYPMRSFPGDVPSPRIRRRRCRCSPGRARTDRRRYPRAPDERVRAIHAARRGDWAADRPAGRAVGSGFAWVMRCLQDVLDD